MVVLANLQEETLGVKLVEYSIMIVKYRLSIW